MNSSIELMYSQFENMGEDDLLERFKGICKLSDQLATKKEQVLKDLNEEQERISTLEQLEEEQRITIKQIQDEISYDKSCIEILEAEQAECQRQKDEFEREKDLLLKLIENRTKERNQIREQKFERRTRAKQNREDFEDSFKKIEDMEIQLKEKQNVNRKLLEDRDILCQKLDELSYGVESYEQQYEEKLELKANLNDLMNEYKTAFEEIEKKRIECEVARDSGSSVVDSIFDAFMKERQELEQELTSAHHDMMEQKVQFTYLSQQLKEVKDDLAHIETIKKETNVPEELLKSRIKALEFAQKQVVLLSNSNINYRKALRDQLYKNQQAKDTNFEERMQIGQLRELDRLSQNLDKEWKERCKIFTMFYEEVKKYEEYKELSRRKAYLKFKLQKKREIENDEKKNKHL